MARDEVNKQAEFYFFLALFLGVLWMFFKIIEPYLGVLFLAMVGAIIFEPWHRRILKKLEHVPYRENLAVLCTLLVILILVLVPLGYLGKKVLSEANALYGTLSSEGGRTWLGQLWNLPQDFFESSAIPLTPPRVDEYVRLVLNWIIGNAGLLVASFLSGLLKMLIGFFALFYFLKYYDRLWDQIIEYSPLSSAYTESILSKLKITIQSVIEGALIVALAQGFVAGVGFALFGVPQPTLWGFLTVIVALIPAIGAAIATLPAVLYLFLVGKTGAAIGLFIWGFFLVGLIDNILKPILLERKIRVPQFLIFLSVIGGLLYFGPIGFLWGPVLLSLFFALLEFYPEILLGRSNS